MNTTVKTKNNLIYVTVHSDEVIIDDIQSALDFIATVRYETNCDNIILNKEALCEEFFALKTRLAGKILQKFVQYHVRLAITGDFSVYNSEALRDFIYESNKGKHIFFVRDEYEAVNLLEKSI